MAGTPRTRVTAPCALGGLDVRSPLSPFLIHPAENRDTDAESLQVTFDPSLVAYTDLLQFFYKMHDPTTKDRQGMDTGTQYRSAIFYHSPEQKQAAEKVTRAAQEQWFKSSGRITTEILEAGRWWDAEEYHQLYLRNNPGGYECPAHFVRRFAEFDLGG